MALELHGRAPVNDLRLRPRLRRCEPAGVVAVLFVAAWIHPVALYLLALAAFGLAHVLSEALWVGRTYGPRLPHAWWWAVAVALGLQAAARLWSWAVGLEVQVAAALDVLTLAAALLAALLALRAVRRPLAAAVASVGLAAVLLWAVHAQQMLPVLAMLAVLHNLTPLALAPGRHHWRGLPLRPVLLVLLAAPFMLWALCAVWGVGALPAQGLWPVEVDLLAGSAQAASLLLGPVVLAQCLHYYAVIRLLPESAPEPEPGSEGLIVDGRRDPAPGAAPPRWLPWVALALCGLLLLYFLRDYHAARALYAVAAGLHAWLEWPLIVLAVGGGLSAEPPAVQPLHIPA